MYVSIAQILLTLSLIHNQNCSPNDSGLESNYSKNGCIFHVFFEALCPYSIGFIQKMEPYVQDCLNCCDIKMYPYGNQKGYTCQHGPDECALNSWIRCVLSHAPNKSVAMKMMMCIENNATKYDPTTTASQCCKEHNMDYKKLLNCVNGTEGDELLSWYANCTKSLKQRLRGVPETRYGPDMRDDLAMNSLILSDFKKGFCKLNSSCPICGTKEKT